MRSLYSLISTGTEMMKLGEAKLSLLGKARARPDQLRKVVDTATQLGPAEAYKRAVNKLDSYTPLGYSCSGVVVAVGAGAEEFSVGQLVACAGNEHALHAEVNWVPVNLCVPVADDVPPQHAAFATVGAIAMHGVRRAEVQLGETACVIGLGLVGQLAVQLLLASGVRVVGFDVVDERCRIGGGGGRDRVRGVPTTKASSTSRPTVRALTNGVGADHIFIAAGGASNDPVHIAARIARDRARVVDIGKTSLDLPWNEYYDKELDVRFSRSYGPGRYDERYELDGIDYPAGLRSLDGTAQSRVLHRPRRTRCAPDRAARLRDLPDRRRARRLRAPRRPLAVRHRIPVRVPRGARGRRNRSTASRSPSMPPRDRVTLGPVNRPLRVGFVGAGSYATSMLLPHLQGDERVELTRVATSKSLSAVNAQRKFGFRHATTGEDSVLDDEDIDVVFIATRHHSHAELVCRALERGKAVFVEKPLALSTDELDRVLATVEQTGNDRLMVGFNRRFAPLFGAMKARFGASASPGSARYVVNAGRLDRSSWYLNEGFEGSRFVGEGGHFIDTLSWWFDARPVEVYAVDGGNAGDVHATLMFDDGSVGSIAYVTTEQPAGSQGDVRRVRVAAAARASTTSVPRPCGRAGAATPIGRGCMSTRASAPSSTRSCARCNAAARCRSRSRRWTRRLEQRSPIARQPAQGATSWGADHGSAPAGTSPACGACRRARLQHACRTRRDTARGSDGASRPDPILPGRVRRLVRAFRVTLPAGTADAVPATARAALLASADALMAGRWEVLGVERDDLVAPDWFFDPCSGRRAPSDVYAFRIQHRSEAVTGNVKQVWELSRHQHLTLLAAAYFVSGEERYAERVAEHLSSWWAANPFLSGVHWTSGIEVGLRLIAWTWIRRLLDEWPLVTDLFENNDHAVRQLYWHQHYLSEFRSRGSSANNHVIAEAAGRLVAADAFPWFAESPAWRAEAARDFQHELARNTFPSGVNRELASEYHGFVAELAYAAAVEADAAGAPLDRRHVDAHLPHDRCRGRARRQRRPPAPSRRRRRRDRTARRRRARAERALVADSSRSAQRPSVPARGGRARTQPSSARCSVRSSTRSDAFRDGLRRAARRVRRRGDRRAAHGAGRARDLVPLRLGSARVSPHRGSRARRRTLRRSPPRRRRRARRSRNVLLSR